MISKECEKCACYILSCDGCEYNREDSESASLACSVAWILFKEKLPEKDQTVLAYRKSRKSITSFHVIEYWLGDEREYTHWVQLVPPKQHNEQR